MLRTMRGTLNIAPPLYVTEAADPRHTALVRQRHQRAFAWEPQGWIPLGIHVVNPEHMSGLEYERWLEPEHFFTAQYQVLRDTLAVGSDLLPVVGINHLGDAVVSSMLGAEQFMPETMGVTLQDVGPAPRYPGGCTWWHRRPQAPLPWQ